MNIFVESAHIRSFLVFLLSS